MKIYKNRITYIRKFCNILIDILFTTILITIVIAIYKFICIILLNIPDLNTIYGSLISVSVTIILAFISYIAKLKKHLPVLLSKIKQRIYQILSWKYNPFLSLVITDFNRNNLSESEEQSKIVNSAICILKNNTQNMILISGLPGRGKTTSLMFLLDAIAHDKELYEIFSKLQNSIAYFDGVNDKNILMSYLGHNNNQKFKLIIIDNIQKYTILSINEIMDRINNLTSHNQNMSEKVLLILLYQKTDRNEALYEYIKNKFFKEDNIFQLNRYVILESNSSQKSCFGHEEELRTRIQKIDDPLFRQHMKYILYNRRDNSIIILLNDLLFAQPTKIVSHKEKIFYVLIAAIIMGLYNGYITKKELHFLWRKKYSFFSLPLEEILIKYYVRNRVLTPFPFIHSSYIFNEQLAKEYRKRLIHNDYYQKQSSLIAETMFLHCEEEMPQKWLFFLLCSSNFCKDFPQYKRIHYFENALSTYHLQYILDLVETEISILSEKEKIFRQELGIIYIYNGDWSKAKKILYPYVQSHDINKDIWHIQLRIIEAEHGGIDDEYLEMLEYIETECTDPVILFQVRYWREHIRMEHGNFCLDTWNELVQEIISADELDCLRRNEHFSIRIISDYERTYFLKGNIHYPRYRNIISEYRHLNVSAQ